MKEDVIRRLIKIVEESNIGELEYSRWGSKIKISKTSLNSHPLSNSGTSQVYAVHPSVPQSQPAVEPAIPDALPATAEKKVTSSVNTIEIKSPMVGTFYRAPTPDSDPYTQVNTHVRKGQVLCIIEAMKLMNEIEADLDGRIVEILVENAQPVEYNQPLFLVEPT